ncbi:hypothetical protein KFL_000190020 [Klebsormidium nitens]|uniref:NADH dehydrogenase [ubiquinone] 1 alpha subcomplex assembly factor 3 n=1 Tax=Klebsormidium nitens TaxID=105231 RepID=A0A1Y1HLD5_KLENI|nr:hypothetical protein KFL_000190020 [Klebsormidium nitens]|eukprot:GAQ78783.1 hypothetical protein KFL_000190020 [Klebsormidium nitens]
MLSIGGRRRLMTMARVEDFNVLSGAAEAGQRVNIDAYDETGFVVDGVDIRGAIVCFGNSTFRWNVSSIADVTPDSLAIFEAIRPAPELLVLGCGSHMVPVSKEVRSFLRKHGIGLEPESTANAAGTFNVLNEEGRKVAAALLPATEIR